MAQNLVDTLLDRAAVRRRVFQLYPFRAWRQSASMARKAGFSATPARADAIARILAAVEENGAHVLPSISSIIEDYGDVVEATSSEITQSGRWPGQADVIESEEVFHLKPALYRAGLSSNLLDMVENYLQEPCYYMGCYLKREPVNASESGNRQWHLDIEDDQMLRVIIYMNSVREGGGPFQFIERKTTEQVKSKSKYRTGYVDDAQMQTLVDRSLWNSAYGAPGAAVFFDGTRVFHRALRPESQDRFSLTFTYATRNPLQFYRSASLTKRTRRALFEALAERQRACIPPAK
ncbi:MAG: hypothetical protein ABW023_13135 [Sphingomonas sp.]